MMARSISELQSKAGYIDARPFTRSSTKPLATHGRTIHMGQSEKCRAISCRSVKRRKTDLSCPAWALYCPASRSRRRPAPTCKSEEDQPTSAERTRALGDAFELLTAQRSRREQTVSSAQHDAHQSTRDQTLASDAASRPHGTTTRHTPFFDRWMSLVVRRSLPRQKKAGCRWYIFRNFRVRVPWSCRSGRLAEGNSPEGKS